MTNPVVDLVGDRTGRIVAVYPQSEAAGLQSWDVDGFVGEALRRVEKVRGLSDPVPVSVLDRYRMVGRSDAYRSIHRPESMQEMVEARRRLVFDELLRIQLGGPRARLDIILVADLEQAGAGAKAEALSAAMRSMSSTFTSLA